MPAVSKKQKKFMQAVANSPKFAKKVGVKQSIGREFTKEKDMNKNYMKGGKVKKMNMGGRAMADRAGAQAMSPAMKRRMEMDMMRAGAGGMKKGGKVKKMAMGGKVGYKAGGMADKMGRALNKDNKGMTAAQLKDAGGRAMMKKGGATKKAKGKGMQGYNARLDDSLGARNGKKSQSLKSRRDESKGVKKAAGKKAYSGNRKSAQGSASKRADGIAQQGHTRGRIV